MEDNIELNQKYQELINDIKSIKSTNIIDNFYGDKLIQVKAENTDFKSIVIKPDFYLFLYRDSENNTFYSCIYKNTNTEIDNMIAKLQQKEQS